MNKIAMLLFSLCSRCMLESASYSAFSPDFGLLASETPLAAGVYNEAAPRFHFSFNSGNTNVEVDNFHVKITAEQRLEDRMVQVIAIPQEQGVRCMLESVQFENLPQSMNLGGPVAKVRAVFAFRSSQLAFDRMHKVVPVQITSVADFSKNSDDARMQGYSCIEKKFLAVQS
jgi:hypothetical protein